MKKTIYNGPEEGNFTYNRFYSTMEKLGGELVSHQDSRLQFEPRHQTWHLTQYGVTSHYIIGDTPTREKRLITARVDLVGNPEQVDEAEARIRQLQSSNASSKRISAEDFLDIDR